MTFYSTGIPLSTYFSAIKLRWMLDHQKAVRIAHEADDLMFGTVDTWLVYVSFLHFKFPPSLLMVLYFFSEFDRCQQWRSPYY